MIKKEDILVLDTETTGFGPSAEILQLSIVNGLGGNVACCAHAI